MITGGIATATTLPSPAHKHSLGSLMGTLQNDNKTAKMSVLCLQVVCYLILMGKAARA
jgi:hypothetical protein